VQSDWLMEGLTASTCAWKIIVSPIALGELVTIKTNATNQGRQEPSKPVVQETPMSDEAKAATRIQAIHRGKLARNNPKKSKSSAQASSKGESPLSWTLTEAIQRAVDQGVSGIVLISGEGGPYGVRYSPPGGGPELHEIGLPPLGWSDPTPMRYVARMELGPTPLISEAALPPRGARAFASFKISRRGRLEVEFHGEDGADLGGSVFLDKPTSRRD